MTLRGECRIRSSEHSCRELAEANCSTYISYFPDVRRQSKPNKTEPQQIAHNVFSVE